MTDTLHKATFDPYLNTMFSARCECGEVFELKLAEITERTDDPQLEQFSLIFHGSKEHYLPQGTYRLAHPQLGEVELFCVPVIGRNPNVHHYQVVFCRFKTRSE